MDVRGCAVEIMAEIKNALPPLSIRPSSKI